MLAAARNKIFCGSSGKSSVNNQLVSQVPVNSGSRLQVL